jgi:hypothetical protein
VKGPAGRVSGRDPANVNNANIPSNETPTTRRESISRRVVLALRESFWANIAAWSAIFFAVVLGLAALGWFFWTGDRAASGGSFFSRFVRESAPAAAPPAAETPAAPMVRRAIDGLPLAAAADDTGYFAVTVENMIEARPLSGLAAAALVIEAPVEGGITRFLAVYPAAATVGKIGPVRSARPYFVEWSREFGALYAHVGGSPDALKILNAASPRSLNQFFWGKYFWRDAGRQMPHNVYTSVELLAGGNSARYGSQAAALPRSWKFKEEAALEERPAASPDIVVDYSTPTYRAAWKYDRARNIYRRYQNDSLQRDDAGADIQAKNVLVQFAKVVVLDEAGRRSIQTAGQGPALAAVDGRTISATWKSLVDGRTRFYDDQGVEITFNAGPTWIEVVPLGSDVAH